MIDLILAAAVDASHAAEHSGVSFDFRLAGELIRAGLAILFIITGVFFVLAGALGVLRLPDFFTRIHAAGMTDTLGLELILLGLIFQSGSVVLSLKFLLVGFFLLLTSPTATHAIADAAYHAGLKPFLGHYKSPDIETLRSGDGDAS